MDAVFEKIDTLTPAQCDRRGRCKLSSLLRLAQEAAEGHCEVLQLDWDTMAKRNLFWAVIRTRAEITRLPETGETVTVKTWPMPTTRTAYPRAAVISDRQGNALVRIVTLWVLMDTETRAMVLPGKSGVEVHGYLLGNEPAAPGSLTPKEGENIHLRRVTEEDLDKNGHVNNARYLDWVDDLLNGAFCRGQTVKEFTVCYLNEAKKDQEMCLNSQLFDGASFQVDGYRTETDIRGKKTRIFSAQLQF